MKYELFAAWPPELYKESEMMTRILMCDTLQIYAEFMNEIFKVKYIEMQLKAIVDCQIIGIHPHMAKIIAKYDLLMYRYYSPVWNRNAEGKLELEAKVEGGDDEDDEYEEDGKYEDQNGKDELDTGGLGKGEGVEIVVLKMVAKNKNKKENDEEEKEQEEEKEKAAKENEEEK